MVELALPASLSSILHEVGDEYQLSARTDVLAKECRRLKPTWEGNKISFPSVETLGFDISALPGLEMTYGTTERGCGKSLKSRSLAG